MPPFVAEVLHDIKVRGGFKGAPIGNFSVTL